MIKLDTVHVEITNRCNAMCPGCTRQDPDTGKLLDFFNTTNEVDWSLSDFKDILPPHIVKDTNIFFGVTIDEPLMNPNFLDIAKYVIECGGNIELDTNAGAGTETTWTEFGILSRDNPGRIRVGFSVDGYEDTNHIYRVNVKWNTVVRNMKAFAQNCKDATWVYLAFDHNEHDIPKAEQLATEMGIKFKVRANTRNIKSWVSNTTIKKDKKIVKETKIVKVDSDSKFKHSDFEKIKKLKRRKSDEYTKSELDTISCLLIDQQEVMIDWSKRMWPCCWWGDAYLSKDKKWMKNIISQYGDDWNRVDLTSIDKILDHEYYASILGSEARYDNTSKFYCGDSCFKHCGDKGKRNYEYFDKDGKSV